MADIIIKKEDTAKKGKILFISTFITLLFVAYKVWNPSDLSIFNNPLVVSGIFALISFISFIWILGFKVNSRIIFLIAPHISAIMFSEILFIQMFFYRAFGRVYEALLMFLILLFIFGVTEISFLTGNVFAVSSFKKIPLEAVAKTSIYFLSLFSVFFVTYGILSLNLNLFFSILVLCVIYFFIIILLLSHFYLETSSVLSNSFSILWNLILILIAGVLFSNRIEVVALLATAVFYACCGIYIDIKKRQDYSKVWEYLFILFSSLIIAFYLTSR